MLESPSVRTGRYASRTLAVVLPMMFAVATGVFGCGDDKTSVLELTGDQIELREREAIERLKETGCKVTEADDPLMGTPGIMVTLFAEHITGNGLIRSEVMSQFRYLSKLFLVVDSTPISADGLTQLRDLDKLLLLSAQWTATDNEGLARIEGIVSLRLLRLNWTPITDDGLRHIERLPELAMLYLSGTRVTDEVVPHIKGLKSLRALQLSHTGISDMGLAALQGFADLTHLGLDGTGVSDEIIPVLASFRSLQYLNLADAKLTTDGKARLRELLPQCQVVTVAKSKVSPSGIGSREEPSPPQEPPQAEPASEPTSADPPPTE
ncbi:MAG: hypothetical protein O3B13_00550 [Planctomycetota bacterium]|nr:hypothetical protein [Planctomycetota bacterium]